MENPSLREQGYLTIVAAASRYGNDIGLGNNHGASMRAVRNANEKLRYCDTYDEEFQRLPADILNGYVDSKGNFYGKDSRVPAWNMILNCDVLLIIMKLQAICMKSILHARKFKRTCGVNETNWASI